MYNKKGKSCLYMIFLFLLKNSQITLNFYYYKYISQMEENYEDYKNYWPLY